MLHTYFPIASFILHAACCHGDPPANSVLHSQESPERDAKTRSRPSMVAHRGLEGRNDNFLHHFGSNNNTAYFTLSADGQYSRDECCTNEIKTLFEPYFDIFVKGIIVFIQHSIQHRI